MGLFFSPLFSGSSGNSILVKSDKASILVDAGKTGKAVTSSLSELGVNKIDAILITHEHSDHIKAAGIISRKFDIPIYATEGTWNGMQQFLGKVKEENIKRFSTDESFDIGDIHIKSFEISHDAEEPVGYSFYIGDKKATIATDTGYISDNIMENIVDSDILYIESNHDVNMLKYGAYPWYLKQRILSNSGHLSNEVTGNLLADIYNEKLKYVILAHLSRENNFPELAYKTVKCCLESNGIQVGTDLMLDVASPDQITTPISI